MQVTLASDVVAVVILRRVNVIAQQIDLTALSLQSDIPITFFVLVF